MRAKRIIITIVLLFFVALPFTILRHDNQPRYQGKSLSRWIDNYAAYVSPLRALSLEESNQPGPQAVRAIGTNALPFLLDWIRYEPSPSKPQEFVTRLLRKLHLPVRRNPAEAQAERAVAGFAMLGTIASPAIPELSRLAGATNGNEAPRGAALALLGIGPSAMPALEAVIRNTNAVARCEAVEYLNYGVRKLGNAAYPILIECLDDPDPNVALVAADALAEVGAEPANVCLKITRHFHHPDWRHRVRALLVMSRYRGQAREQMRTIVPDLVGALADTNSLVRERAESILRKVAPEVLTNAPAP